MFSAWLLLACWEWGFLEQRKKINGDKIYDMLYKRERVRFFMELREFRKSWYKKADYVISETVWRRLILVKQTSSILKQFFNDNKELRTFRLSKYMIIIIIVINLV